MIPASLIALKVYGVFCLTILTVPLICAGIVMLIDAWKEWRNHR